MKVKCSKCDSKQVDKEKICMSCGANFGKFEGEKFLLFCLLFLALIPIFLFTTSTASKFLEIIDPRVFFWYYLPLISLLLIFYDYHPTRRSFYFFGTAIVVVLSFFVIK
jgi:hypothetical protein